MKDNKERLEHAKLITEILNTNLKGLGCLSIDEIKVLEKLRQVLIFSLKENEIVLENKMQTPPGRPVK